jgi:hypothetical protein
VTPNEEESCLAERVGADLEGHRMIELVIAALLPVLTVLGLGYFAGWHGDFDRKQASILTRMVMLYALPLLLFAGTASIPRKELLAQLPLALILALGSRSPISKEEDVSSQENDDERNDHVARARREGPCVGKVAAATKFAL